MSKNYVKQRYIEYYCTLFQSFILKLPLSLPFQIMLPVLLVPTGRGVIKDGCTIFMPSKNDYLKYVYYHENRCKLSTSSTRQGDKRLGEWRGENMNISVKKNILRKNILRDDEGKNVLHASIVAVKSSSNFTSSSRIHCNNRDGINLDTHNNNKNNNSKLNSRKDNII